MNDQTSERLTLRSAAVLRSVCPFHLSQVGLPLRPTCRGVVLSPAVVPIGLTVTWPKLTRAGVFSGCTIGAVLGMLAWMIGCLKIYGEINITNLALPYSAVCSGLTGILFSSVFTVFVSLARTFLNPHVQCICPHFYLGPANYDFQDTRAIATYDSSENSLPSTKPAGSDQSTDYEDEKMSPMKESAQEVQVVVSELEEDVLDQETLRSVFRRAIYYSTVLTVIVTIAGKNLRKCGMCLPMTRRVLVPLPMFFSHYVFSKGFYTFWVACSMYVNNFSTPIMHTYATLAFG